MPDPSPITMIHQQQSPPIVKTKDESFDALLKNGSAIRAAIEMRGWWQDYFQAWFESFLNIYNLTKHENIIKESRWGSISLVIAIDNYLLNSPKKNIKIGLRLASAYQEALLNAGICHYRG